MELKVRLEPLTLEEITRVWEALEGSYQLSVSYEVSVVNIMPGARTGADQPGRDSHAGIRIDCFVRVLLRQRSQ